ncbi:MAG: aminofutalosine synthase MqnE [Tenuifilaceae bacterium]|jgi:aminodeoxyfutalosine synthase|nr:aminofutalosine synthase MqnE [Bacteroidales bacterium]MDI9516243.1 aminofutalosine synthase MqnE [Bacteroidota bacterium]HNV80427.1 aminofutalosine synthase MqnE [Tenuifilaceae bacterium]HOF90525.1 aminofutalosine synthase MqnE [Tenuifilaceae bacterium]HOM84469.1 aminofutalosine synthase MqnE [Tenuifilaceae bacterium]
MASNGIEVMGELLGKDRVGEPLKSIVRKVLSGVRISCDDAVTLFQKADLSMLGLLAGHVNQQKNGTNVFFNRNFHIEPTNVCVYSCSFCSFKRIPKEEGSWVLSLDDIAAIAKSFRDKGVTEVHVTGGAHPRWKLRHLAQIIKTIKGELPDVHVKAFSAAELDYVFSKVEKISPEEGLKQLIKDGLNSIPGGGAEIFDAEIRNVICGEKLSGERWLEIHEVAHSLGLTSNATMLYGHIENYSHRVDHLNRLRQLQDRTGGFNCFIPLKFKAKHNSFAHVGEVNSIEDLKTIAVSRIFLDNFNHIKAYWPMLGKQIAMLALSFGANDLDGTIDDTTKIYSMAGAEDANPGMTVEEICNLIRQAGKNPVERDSLYNTIRSY